MAPAHFSLFIWIYLFLLLLLLRTWLGKKTRKWTDPGLPSQTTSSKATVSCRAIVACHHIAQPNCIKADISLVAYYYPHECGVEVGETFILCMDEQTVPKHFHLLHSFT